MNFICNIIIKEVLKTDQFQYIIFIFINFENQLIELTQEESFSNELQYIEI